MNASGNYTDWNYSQHFSLCRRNGCVVCVYTLITSQRQSSVQNARLLYTLVRECSVHNLQGY